MVKLCIVCFDGMGLKLKFDILVNYIIYMHMYKILTGPGQPIRLSRLFIELRPDLLR